VPKILYCDNHLLALDKPAGMLTQPDPSGSYSLEDWGKDYLKKEFDKKGNVFLEAVHRLDKPVSGVVLFARTSKGLCRVQEKIRARMFKKIYFAKVEGHLDEKEGLMEDYLIHEDHRASIGDEGKLSQLRYKVMGENAKCSFVEIELLTGRYHQIRLQFSNRGFPIVGDRKYGSRMHEERMALHHFRLETTHPTTDAPLVFESPCPFRLVPC
jgi:23S rRNA pseudouridine1911/1915/1917 synthase